MSWFPLTSMWTSALFLPLMSGTITTLVTMGMGAHRMNVPEELAEYKLERAELAIALPPDWKLDEESLKDERWYWPIGLLKVLARLPISNNTWLGFGHTMDKQSPFAEDTELCAVLLVGPQDVVWNGGEVCTLPERRGGQLLSGDPALSE